MKKIILRIALLLVVLVITSVGVYKAQTVKPALSALALENVEALADDETGGLHITCYYGSCGSSFLCKCSDCTWGYVKTTRMGTCY